MDNNWARNSSELPAPQVALEYYFAMGEEFGEHPAD
jgi:hypothetical protein